MGKSTRNDMVDFLSGMPLFENLGPRAIGRIIDAMDERKTPQGETLFEYGGPGKDLYVLMSGKVRLICEGREIHRLTPLQLFGEVGTLTEIPRNTTAVTEPGSILNTINRDRLLELFEENRDMGLVVYKNLADIIASKFVIHQGHTDEIRGNLIRTQKEMKHMLDMILEQPETPLSEPTYDILNNLVSKNSRSNYRLQPSAHLPAHLVLHDKTLQVSNVSMKGMAVQISGIGPLPKVGEHISGVFNGAGTELPVSGKVIRKDNKVLAISLDLMIDKYKSHLADYLVRIQLLSLIV
ncbi:MAG: cyclic nucleotide-binding domain-containing protein [Desulfobacterales bacterium]|nr:cyclic nucleotide-binding domain-containing protein [Desulfobacterales bacterium]